MAFSKRGTIKLVTVLFHLCDFCAPQAIYRRLSDEPDGMVGLDVMRGAAGVSASMKQRTWQHEHAEDWAGALEVPFHVVSPPRLRMSMGHPFVRSEM